MKKSILGIISLFILVAGCAGNAKPVVTTVAKPTANTDEMTLDQALKNAAVNIDSRIEAGSKIAALNFNSPHDKFSGYVLDELTANLVDSGKLTVVDRKEIDLIRGEVNFEYSGEVADDSMQTVGRMLGAQEIISGSLTDMGGFYRIVIRVLNVQNASVDVQYRANIANDAIMAALLTGGKAPPMASAPQKAPAADATAQSAAAALVQTPVAQVPVQAVVAPPAPLTYKIGSKGPAGGIIFYDKGSSAGGWQYLEAAPASTEQKDVQWSISAFTTGANRIEVGTGKINTRNIMDASVQAAVNAPAARYCDRLEYGGYDDWYLPSKNELGLMYMNLKVDGLGGFGADWYWSSSEYNDNSVWMQQFSDGSQDSAWNYINKPRNHSVRAIRQF